jgi:NADPH-dependent ferric siderophore reductase
VQRVRYELRRRQLRVSAVAPLGTGFVAVHLSGEDLHDFQSASFDDHVKLFVDGPDGQPVGRDYTPRAFDAQRRELTLEFALHGPGAASDWARRVAVGQTLWVGGPRGSMVVPMDYAWHGLAGDATALPAVRRRLEELPPGAQSWVLLQADPAEAGPLPWHPGLQVHWAADEAQWLARLACLPWPQGEGFVWCAGEAAAMAAAREVLLQQRGHPREHLRVAAYWKRGVAAHHQTLASAEV